MMREKKHNRAAVALARMNAIDEQLMKNFDADILLQDAEDFMKQFKCVHFVLLLIDGLFRKPPTTNEPAPAELGNQTMHAIQDMEYVSSPSSGHSNPRARSFRSSTPLDTRRTPSRRRWSCSNASERSEPPVRPLRPDCTHFCPFCCSLSI